HRASARRAGRAPVGRRCRAVRPPGRPRCVRGRRRASLFPRAAARRKPQAASRRPVPHGPQVTVLRIGTRKSPLALWQAARARKGEGLPKGARVGTSSLRRAVQLLAVRPDLVIVPVRGNVQTRLSKAVPGLAGGVQREPAAGDPQGPLDAVVLALAGLRRLGLEEHVTEVLPIEVSLPAAGQGALAIEARRSTPGWAAASPLDDPAISPCVRAER